MILIPKHIENYMYQIEHFLVCSKSPKRDYFLDNLRYTLKSLKSFAGLSYISNDDLVEAFYLLVELVYFENELKEQVPSFKGASYFKDVEAELTSVLNAYSYNISYTDDVDTIINFIQKPVDDMYVSSCDYIHFKLIKSEEEWNNLSKEALIETDIGCRYLIAKAIFMINDPLKTTLSGTRLAFAESTLKEEFVIQDLDVEPALFEKIFNLWFQLGIHGTFFIYLPKYVNEK